MFQVNAMPLEIVVEGRLRDSPFGRDDHRLVILIAISVDHDHNLPQLRKYIKRFSIDQVGVLQSDVRREKRLWDASAIAHPIQADFAAQIAQKIDPIADYLRPEE
jgi:hypothetical protein